MALYRIHLVRDAKLCIVKIGTESLGPERSGIGRLHWALPIDS